jgi:Xaa-Pro aminopeptidase
MKPSSKALFVSNDEVPSNGDALHPFRQNSDLYWLSGIMQEDSMVILYPDNPDPKFREVLVLVRPNELKEKWDGKRLRKEEAIAMSGIQTVVWLDVIDSLLQTWVHLADTVYLDTNENDRKASLVRTRDYRFVDEMKSRYPLHQYERAAKILKELRSIKTGFEIDVTKKAVEITHNAFVRVMKFMKPGVMEYEVEAEIIHSFLSQRASGEAYGSIIASGDRARTLHYVSNNQECRDGELVLMDFGASYVG